MSARILASFIIISWLWASPVAACETLSEHQKIEQLLKLIESSDMQFIRNGKAYDGSAARKHLEEKLNYAGNKIKTGEQFIQYIASKSSLTGAPYHVRLPDGKEMESEVWLNHQLSVIEANACTSETHSDGLLVIRP